ncbi:MAG: transglycosylase SLT domain-containing protein [Kiloniellaceae bacterium]
MTRAGLRSVALWTWLVACPATAQAGAPSASGDSAMLSPHDRKVFASAFREVEAKRFQQARALAARAQDPLLAKVIVWLDLIEPARPGDFAEAARFLTRNPEWPGQAALQLRAARTIPDDWPDDQVIAWFRGHPPLTAGSAVRYAEALMRAGERERAANLLRTAWIDRDFSGREERAFRKRYGHLLRREDDIARLDRLLWDRASRPAMRQARRLGGGYPALAEARLLLARAGPGVDSAIRRVPAELRADPGLIYERARWRQRRGMYEGVIELLDPPDPAAPRPERWWPLRHWAARQALMNGDISRAYRIAGGHGMAAGLGFAEAEWLAGWIALRFLDQPKAAYEHFKRLHRGVSLPISLARSAFWAGEAASRMDARDPAGHWHATARQWYAAAAEHDTSFYGQLASRRLGRAPRVDLSVADAPDHDARAAFGDRELVRIVRMLGELGQTRLQERFLVRLQILAETAEDYTLVAGLAAEQRRPDLALRVAKAARSEGVLLPRHLFPGLPLPEGRTPEPALVLALIRQESGFYPAAVSRAGARGLMQILPRTAKQVARRIKVRYNRRNLLSDPEYNLLLGRTYLSDLLERYDGSYLLALAAYNAGPARASRWIDALGDPRDPDVDPVDWIESIPLDETRNYVQRILEGLVVYRQRLGVHADGPVLVPRLSPLTSWTGAAPPADLSCCL